MGRKSSRKKQRRQLRLGLELFHLGELEELFSDPRVHQILHGYDQGEELTPEVIARLVHEEGFAAVDLQTFAEQGFRWNAETRSMWLPPEVGS